MADKNVDQDKLAEEWAKALETQESGGEDAAAEAADGNATPGSESEEKDQDQLAEEWAKALAEEEAQKTQDEKKQKQLAAQAEEVQFRDLSEEAAKVPEKQATAKRDLDFILDIPLSVSAELGRSKLLINDLLQLGQGSVIELDKLAGEPLEILVNGKLVARGEAVVINEKFGVRLTDIISPMERVKQLG